jgi:hypothetical protein
VLCVVEKLLSEARIRSRRFMCMFYFLTWTSSLDTSQAQSVSQSVSQSGIASGGKVSKRSNALNLLDVEVRWIGSNQALPLRD